MYLAPFYLALEPNLLLSPVENQKLPSRGRKCAPHLPQCFIRSMLARRFFRHSSGYSPLSSLHFPCERICSTNPSDFKGAPQTRVLKRSTCPSCNGCYEIAAFYPETPSYTGRFFSSRTPDESFGLHINAHMCMLPR